MKYLFFHQNFPGQFRHIATHLAADPNNQVVFVTQRNIPDNNGIRIVTYAPHREGTKGIHAYAASLEKTVIAGQGAARAVQNLLSQGFRPDIMIGHPGWGETLFLKDILPDVPLLSYGEYFYNGHGADIGFDPEFPADFDTICRVRGRNAPHLLAIDIADRVYSPTHWQKQQFPRAYQSKIEVIHDGVDCDLISPDPTATIELESGLTLTPKDEVLAFVARDLEPFRGMHSFIRALPRFLELRPNAQVVIVGNDGTSYGRKPRNGGTWRQVLMKEVTPPTDRLHFTGKLPYDLYLRVLQVATARIYLTYPFVLSWSMLDAMAAECLVIGSKTPPVEEVIRDGENGLLVDFFNPDEIAERAAFAMEHRHDMLPLRRAARQTVLDHYELGKCQARLQALIREMTG